MTILGYFLFCLGAIIFYSVLIEPRLLRIRRFKIQLKKPLPRPITILHLSDIHFCGRQKYKERWFRKLRLLSPDLIFITGDIIDNDGGIEQAADLLGALPAKFGKFAILGNHDYFDYHIWDNLKYHLFKIKWPQHPNNVELFKKKLEEKKITVLVNQSHAFTAEGVRFVVGGTDDPVTQQVDFEKTLKETNAQSINLVMTHLLDSILMLSFPNPIDAVFAGHTHGGQVRLPGLGPVVCETEFPKKYIEGLHEHHGTPVCVSQGMGASRTQVFRLFCPPEAVWIELYS
jgi:predicted MPP superfamily phosphohydrolase